MVQRAKLTLSSGQLQSVIGRDFGSVGEGFDYSDLGIPEKIKRSSSSSSSSSKVNKNTFNSRDSSDRPSRSIKIEKVNITPRNSSPAIKLEIGKSL